MLCQLPLSSPSSGPFFMMPRGDPRGEGLPATVSSSLTLQTSWITQFNQPFYFPRWKEIETFTFFRACVMEEAFVEEEKSMIKDVLFFFVCYFFRERGYRIILFLMVRNQFYTRMREIREKICCEDLDRKNGDKTKITRSLNALQKIPHSCLST